MGRLIGSVGLAPGSDEGTDLTTKGDLHGYSSSNTRIPISTNNFSLLCDSAQALGLKWAASSTSVLSQSGDILYASGANTLARLAKGSNDEVLTLKSGLPSWEASSGGGAFTLIETKTLGSDATSMTITLDPVVSPPNAVYVTFSGEWDDAQDLGIQLNGLDSDYIQYGAIYKPSALSAIAQTGEDHAELVDNNISSDESGWASGLYRANPVTELIEGTSIGGGNTGWVSVSIQNTTASQSSIDEVKIAPFSSANIRAGSIMSVYKLSGS